jgi:hypothetical protein
MYVRSGAEQVWLMSSVLDNDKKRENALESFIEDNALDYALVD